MGMLDFILLWAVCSVLIYLIVAGLTTVIEAILEWFRK